MSKRSKSTVSDCRCGGTAQGEGGSAWGYYCDLLPKTEPKVFSITANPLVPKENGFVLDFFFYPHSFMPHAQDALAGAAGREGSDVFGAGWGCTLLKEQTPADFNPCFLQYKQCLGLYLPARPCLWNLSDPKTFEEFVSSVGSGGKRENDTRQRAANSIAASTCSQKCTEDKLGLQF